MINLLHPHIFSFMQNINNCSIKCITSFNKYFHFCMQQTLFSVGQVFSRNLKNQKPLRLDYQPHPCLLFTPGIDRITRWSRLKPSFVDFPKYSGSTSPAKYLRFWKKSIMWMFEVNLIWTFTAQMVISSCKCLSLRSWGHPPLGIGQGGARLNPLNGAQSKSPLRRWSAR